MHIADIQTAVIAANYDWTLIKMRTDDGTVGYGERMRNNFKFHRKDAKNAKINFLFICR